MEFSKEKMKQIRKIIFLVAALVLGIMYSTGVWLGITFLFGIIRPFLYGGVTAFILNIPMRHIEKTLFRGNGKIAKKIKRPVSMLLAIVSVLLVITLVLLLLIPQLTKAATTLGQKIPPFIGDVTKELENLSKRYPELQNQISMLQNLELNWNSIVDNALQFLKNGVGSMLSSTVNVASSIVGGVVRGVIAIIFALYVLAQKEKLASQGKRILSAYAPEKVQGRVLKILHMLYENFSNFFSGQCLEAVIITCLFIFFMLIFRFPYAVMVGVLVGALSLIPIVGAFFGCAIGAFFIVIENPMQALWFIIMFLIIQQLEGNLIYPRVVGNSVGLPAIWVLVAVSLGGSLFGIAGMLFFIPLTATAYTLLRDHVNERNRKKAPKKPAEPANSTKN